MKYQYTIYLILIAGLFILSCESNTSKNISAAGANDVGAYNAHHQEVHLSEKQFEALTIKLGRLSRRTMKDYVETNGQLTLPPQNQAAVTAVIGANIRSIEVIEGFKVNKGQPLAYLYHPDLVQLQMDYNTAVNQLEYLEKEYQRQQKLFEQSVGAGKDFQKTKADYQSMKGRVNGLEAKLRLLAMNVGQIKNGKIDETVALESPIAGYVNKVNVRTGQYVSPQDVLFEIVHNDHIHAHFKIFERDYHKVKEGQMVRFVVESQPEIQRDAEVFAVGMVFEPGTKAVNLHVEIENESGTLLPGMYVRGKIITGGMESYALPKEGVVMEGNQHYIFSVEEVTESGHKAWYFTPMEVTIGVEDDGWVEIKPHDMVSDDMMFAMNNAYYLLAEMDKDEGGHDH
ncbi:MAG TPA: efflux RND transporter periplasmic adaptor subunit [Cyclobacteriaceae bacterium]